MKRIVFIVLFLIASTSQAGNCYFIGGELFCDGKQCTKVGDQYLDC